MSALVVMMLVGYFLLIAFALMLWAAFTVRGGRAGSAEDEDVEEVRPAPEPEPARAPARSARAGTGRPDAPRPPTWTPPDTAGDTGTSNGNGIRRGTGGSISSLVGIGGEEAAGDGNGDDGRTALSNDDVRGLRVRRRRASGAVGPTFEERSGAARVREADGHDTAAERVRETDKDDSAAARVRETDKDDSAAARVRETDKDDSAAARIPPWRRTSGAGAAGDRDTSDTGDTGDDAARRRERGEEAFERFLRAEERKR